MTETKEVSIEDLSIDEKFNILFHQITALQEKLEEEEEDPLNTKFSCLAYAIQSLVKPESQFDVPKSETIVRYAQAFENFVNK